MKSSTDGWETRTPDAWRCVGGRVATASTTPAPCLLGKSQHKAHPYTTDPKAGGYMQLMYTGLVGPMTSSYGRIPVHEQFTDDFSRMKEISSRHPRMGLSTLSICTTRP